MCRGLNLSWQAAWDLEACSATDTYGFFRNGLLKGLKYCFGVGGLELGEWIACFTNPTRCDSCHLIVHRLFHLTLHYACVLAQPQAATETSEV